MKYLQLFLNWLRRKPRKDSQSDPEKGAITVAETLIALGIGSTILAVVFAGIPALTDARNHSTSMSGLTQIVTSIRSTFGVRNNFDGLDTDLARQLAGFPPNFVGGDDIIRHPWGGLVTITGDNDGTFDVAFADLPESSCSQLVTSTADLAQTINVGGTVLGTAGEDGDGNPTDPQAVTDLCDGGAEVTWTFRG